MKTVPVYVPYDDGDSYAVGELSLPEDFLQGIYECAIRMDEDPIIVFDKHEDGSIGSVEIKFSEWRYNENRSSSYIRSIG